MSQAHGGADDRCAQAGGGGAEDSRGGAREQGFRSTPSMPGGRSMAVSEGQETEQLRDENTPLRKLVADMSLAKAAGGRLEGWPAKHSKWSSKKGRTIAGVREDTVFVLVGFHLSEAQDSASCWVWIAPAIDMN